MRPILLALACLSTFAMAQNVLAIAPTQELASGIGPGPVETSVEFETTLSVADADADADAPLPGALSLFVAGLAGLTIAGGRRQERSEPSPSEA